MNLIEAVEKALSQNVALMNTERNEWLIISGGALRWKNNRQPASLTPKDILSVKWITEEDLITISKIQIEEALSFLHPTIEDGEQKIVGFDHFWNAITNAVHTNKQRAPEPGE